MGKCDGTDVNRGPGYLVSLTSTTGDDRSVRYGVTRNDLTQI